ncbi:MAG: F420-dependent methylenetetrahydromethanopterin dehydrogenase [Candidatus Ranarchaeia archaeon]
MVNVVVVKLGAIGASPLLEFLLDEIASRQDIVVRVVSSGAKMTESESEAVAQLVSAHDPDLILISSPVATNPGPAKAREILAKIGKPVLVISDGPSKKDDREALLSDNVGYFICLADAMIGAKQQFLDPIEMSLFNTDVIKVLAGTGVLRLLVDAIDEMIASIKKGETVKVPAIYVSSEKAVNAQGFSNPYAKAKAMAAYEIAARSASLSTKGTFRIKEKERYLIILAAAHEMMRAAGLLADEAREIEKANDTVQRRPHKKDGSVLQKVKLLEKAE